MILTNCSLNLFNFRVDLVFHSRKLSDEEKAQHTVNNAHKSHRKHLLHAVERSPNFLLIHRNDKVNLTD